MHRPRLIPCLLLDGQRLVKTIRYANSTYIGDPINTIKIFNEKEVDELIILDINASKTGSPPDFDYIRGLASECFMPVCYGGGIKSLADAERLITSGIEKIAINSVTFNSPALVGEIARQFGNQSVVVGIDVKKNWMGNYRVWNSSRRQSTSYSPTDWARQMAESGAGEILLNLVDRDGTLKGYDISLVKTVVSAVTVPVIASGGAASLPDCRAVIMEGGAAAAAAGALFVYKGPHRAVLISYPDARNLQELFS